MSHAYETLFVEAGGPASGLLLPGRVQRALADGAGIRAEDVGLIRPLERGRVEVEVATHRAHRIATPLALPMDEGGRPALLILRRPHDAPGEADTHVILPWTHGDGAPSPGCVSAAIAKAMGGELGQEEVGAGLAGPNWLRLALPERILVRLELPLELEIAGTTMTLSAVADGKKKP